MRGILFNLHNQKWSSLIIHETDALSSVHILGGVAFTINMIYSLNLQDWRQCTNSALIERHKIK